MNKIPHKHAEVIKAWADGAVIQYRGQGGVWFDIIGQEPSWMLVVEYRVKPEEKSYGEIAYWKYCEALNLQASSGWEMGAENSKKAWSAGIESAIQEFCKRNNLNRSEMK